MGCSSNTSRFNEFIVQYCILSPIINKKNIFKIDLISEEKIKKVEGARFLDQCGQSNNLQVINFLESENIKENTIFYYFLREKPILKTLYQSIKYQPFSLPKLFHIILLSIDHNLNIPNQLVERKTKNLSYDKFIGKELDLDEMIKKIENANNPNITKDSIDLDIKTEYEEDEIIKEKENEIIICKELNKELYDKILFKFKNLNSFNNDNNNIETQNDDNKKEIEDCHCSINSKINTIKILSCKLDNSLFYKVMRYLQNKNIRKFCFFDNNINSDFEGWDSISDFFENNYNLRYIDLHCSNLIDNNLNDLIRSLTDKRIRFLDLSENFLSLEGIKIVSSYLKINKTLKKLNLSRNSKTEFKADGVKSILESLKSNQNIEYIDFSFMNLTGSGQYIGNFLSTNKSLQKLILRNDNLNAKDFKNIFKVIKINNSIKEIDVSLNDMGGDKSLQYIADGIKENKSLNCLKIDKININNENYQIIFDGIEQNENINYYTVNYNSKIKPVIMLNFFKKQKQVKKLEYEPYEPFDKTKNDGKNRELTLEEKKLFEIFKKERPDIKLLYK